MNEERYKNEVSQLQRLKALLDGDAVLPLRLKITPESLNLRRFRLDLLGIPSLTGSAATAADHFVVQAEIPAGYPATAIPSLRFLPPIPFHPHIFSDGRICWGTGSSPQTDLFLVDWVRGLVEYLQFDQDRGSLLRINPASPANGTAMDWWKANQRRISSFVRPIDIMRLRFWINQARG